MFAVIHNHDNPQDVDPRPNTKKCTFTDAITFEAYMHSIAGPAFRQLFRRRACQPNTSSKCKTPARHRCLPLTMLVWLVHFLSSVVSYIIHILFWQYDNAIYIYERQTKTNIHQDSIECFDILWSSTSGFWISAQICRILCYAPALPYWEHKCHLSTKGASAVMASPI